MPVMRNVIAYFLAEIEILQKEARESDEPLREDDPYFLLRLDLQDMMTRDDSGKTALKFLFGGKKPKLRKTVLPVVDVSGKLNESQKTAIRYALKSDMLAVEGPPGNGKSEMITALLINAIVRGERVLIASQNNKAVDSVAEKVRAIGINELFIRTGNTYYRSKAIQSYIRKIGTGKKRQVVLWRVLAMVLRSWPRVQRMLARARAQQLIFKRARYLRKIRQWADEGKTSKAIRSLLDICHGWGVTNLAARSNFPLDAGIFDLLIIDEAAQCPAGPIIPLLYRAKRVVAVGDRNQLKPIMEHEEEREKLISLSPLSVQEKERIRHGESFFDWVVQSTGREPLLLDEHYRCHPEIIAFNNQFFYAGALKIRTPRTAGAAQGMFWLDSKLEGEYFENHVNMKEVSDVCHVVQYLHEALGVSYGDIGVITPFTKQERKLVQAVKEVNSEVLCGTIYKFQGSEKEFIIISLCLHDKMREGTKHWVDRERSLINVATSRAKKGLIIVADMDEALKRQEHVRKLAEYYNSLGKELISS